MSVSMAAGAAGGITETGAAASMRAGATGAAGGATGATGAAGGAADWRHFSVSAESMSVVKSPTVS